MTSERPLQQTPGQPEASSAVALQKQSMDNLCQHAFDVFSQLFSQVDFSVIDGFTYISGGNATFTSLNLLKFGRNYLNGALADDQLQLIFLEMDTDFDGKVSFGDWQNYFRGKLAHRSNAAAGRASAVVFVGMIFDRMRHEWRKETLKHELIVETLREAFDEAVTDVATPRPRTPTGFDHVFISRQQFVTFFSRIIESDDTYAVEGQKEEKPGTQVAPCASKLTMDHVFDLFTYLDANGDALIEMGEWLQGLGVLLEDDLAAQQTQIRHDEQQQHSNISSAGHSTAFHFIDLMLKFFHHNNVNAQAAFCYFVRLSEFNPDAEMTKEAFDIACKEYLASHIDDDTKRSLMWSALLAHAASHAHAAASAVAPPDRVDAVGAEADDDSNRNNKNQIITGAQWCSIFSEHQLPAAPSTHRELVPSLPQTAFPSSGALLPDPNVKRVTAMMAALLFYNGMSVQDGFAEFADGALLSLHVLKSSASRLLEHVSADDLEHWFKYGLGGGDAHPVSVLKWIEVMEPATAAHAELVCREYMLVLAKLFRQKTAADVLADVLKCIVRECGDDNMLSLAHFADALLKVLLREEGREEGGSGLLRAAGKGGVDIMVGIWATALPQQQQQQQQSQGVRLSEDDLGKAVQTMAHAVTLLLPDDYNNLLLSLLCLAAVNDVPLAHHPAAATAAQTTCLFDFLCDSSDDNAHTSQASAAAVLQLSRENFAKTIAGLLQKHGIPTSELESLWSHLFGSSSTVDQATWNRVMSSAGIHFFDESLQTIPSENCEEELEDPAAPNDRLHSLLNHIQKNPNAAIVCQAVQFECRSNLEAARALLRDACEYFGCVTRNGLRKALTRCLQKYSDGGDPSFLQQAGVVADLLWNIASLASASPLFEAKVTLDEDGSAAAGANALAASAAPPLLPPIIIAAIIEAIRKHTTTELQTGIFKVSLETLHPRGDPVARTAPPSSHRSPAVGRFVGDDERPTSLPTSPQDAAVAPAIQYYAAAQPAAFAPFKHGDIESDNQQQQQHTPVAAGESTRDNQQQQQHTPVAAGESASTRDNQQQQLLLHTPVAAGESASTRDNHQQQQQQHTPVAAGESTRDNQQQQPVPEQLASHISVLSAQLQKVEQERQDLQSALQREQALVRYTKTVAGKMLLERDKKNKELQAQIAALEQVISQLRHSKNC